MKQRDEGGTISVWVVRNSNGLRCSSGSGFSGRVGDSDDCGSTRRRWMSISSSSSTLCGRGSVMLLSVVAVSGMLSSSSSLLSSSIFSYALIRSTLFGMLSLGLLLLLLLLG